MNTSRLLRARTLLLALLALPLVTLAGLAQQTRQKEQPAQVLTPSAKVLEDIWEVALVTDAAGVDQKIGYSRFQVVELELQGKKHLRARRELRLTVGRGRDEAMIRADMGTDETADGKVIGVYAKIWTGKEEAITLTGKLQDNQMRVQVEGGRTHEQVIPWNPEIVGLIRELDLLREKKAKPGDRFTYKQYVPTLNSVLGATVSVVREEEVRLPGAARKLLRVEVKPDKVKIPGGSGDQEIQLPISVQWVDPGSYVPVLTQTELPGVGAFKLVRTSRQAALAPNGTLPNLFATQSIPIARIPEIHRATAVTYRFTMAAKEADLKGLLKEDARQSVEKGEGNTLTLHVEAVRGPARQARPAKAGDEYLEPNYFIDGSDAEVIRLARAAVGAEADPWRKAQRIERWVFQNMKPINFTEALAPSGSVAKSLSGDCSEYAMLTAAMCRAERIPSRTAVGLVYVGRNDTPQPVLGFHMWTEVFVEGQWLAIDATMGEGSVGAGHLKITDHHWKDIRSFEPLLSVTGFMLARPQVEVLSVRRPR